MKKKSTITIHEGFTDGCSYYTSYHSGLTLIEKGIDFTTHCYEFLNSKLNNHDVENVVVVDIYGKVILDLNLLYNKYDTTYTDKEIRFGHNIYSMYMANAFRK